VNPYYQDDSVTLHHGDALDILTELPDASVDAVVTDPPYGLANTTPEQVADTLVRWINGERDYVPSGAGFMGKRWDAFVPPVAVWDECLRVLKPGGHLLAFSGSRTFDLMAIGVRMAGFDIRDGIAWLYGSGFPKSLDVSKAIDKAAGAEREVTGVGTPFGSGSLRNRSRVEQGYRPTELNPSGGAAKITAPATPDAARWQGWGTALKPAFEPIVVARKPLAGTVAANVLAHGTGALNIDGCRVAGEKPATTRGASVKASSMAAPLGGQGRIEDDGKGRWPTNVVLDDTQAAELDRQSGTLTSGSRRAGDYGLMGYMGADAAPMPAIEGDAGGASRFFPTFRYEAKAPTSERPRAGEVAHPTVKPLDLMRWLVRLVTPPGGTVLEPFAGSGTTAEACVIEGFQCIAIEREADYLPLIVGRLTKPIQVGLDFGGVA